MIVVVHTGNLNSL